MKKIHYTPDYLINPPHPITVHVIGAGGNGSQVIQGLARMNVTLKALDHPGLIVALFDDDKVTESNQGRQLFAHSDIGRYKAEVLISRINRFYGFGWYHENVQYNNELEAFSNIVIGCVDSAKSRLDISETWMKKKYKYKDWENPYYWLDLGNSQKTGQVILGTGIGVKQPKSKLKTVKILPTIDQEFDLTIIKDDDEPSCSIAEAIHKQDLFINPIVSYYGLNLLWKLFKDCKIDHRGYYINLDSGRTNPIGL
jgi:PRTRC genetic system ThiF family protein